MFKLNPNPTFTVKVALSVPGQAEPKPVDITFKHLARPQIREFFAGLEGKTDQEALAEVVTGWGGVDVPFSPEALGSLLDNYPPAGGELFEAFRRELMESRRKN